MPVSPRLPKYLGDYALLRPLKKGQDHLRFAVRREPQSHPRLYVVKLFDAVPDGTPERLRALDAELGAGRSRLEHLSERRTSLGDEQRELAEARIEYRGPLEAPIAQGAHVADLVIPRDELPDARIALVSDREVVRGGFLPRMRAAVFTLFRMAAGEALALRE